MDASSRPAFSITVSGLGFLSFAMAYGKIAAVHEVSIAHFGVEPCAVDVELEAWCAIGSLGRPTVTQLELPAAIAGTPVTPGVVTLRTPGLNLDPAAMLAVGTQLDGEVRVTVRDEGGTVLAMHHEPIAVLSPQQWNAEPIALGLELLAAHVQPQSPALTPVLQDASYLLRLKTGRETLDGYESDDPGHVDAIVEAVVEALRARGVRAAVAPTSWGQGGQRIRTPQEVLEGGFGTGLDLTLTLAALLEAIGINSTLWVLEGDAFLGYWRRDDSLEVVADTHVSDVVNLVGLGRIRLIDIGAITGGTQSGSFAEATHTARVQPGGGFADVLGVTDVRQARLNGIFPLPSRGTGDGGAVVIHEYLPPSRMLPPAGAVPLPGVAAGPVIPRAEVPPRVAQWKNALLDLSLRNRLINYTPTSGLALQVPGAALPRLEDLINRGQSLQLLPADRIGQVDRERGIRTARDLPDAQRTEMLEQRRQAHINVTESVYVPRLRAVAYKARTLIEETGANNLYLAFGMLSWRVDDRQLRSPLVLVPVRLHTTARGQSFTVALDEAGASTPNFCLLEKLRLEHGITIPGLATPAEDGEGIDLAAAFGALREALAEAKLDFFVEDTVELSVLQFAKFRLWKDLDEHWESLAENALVSHLISSPTEAFIDPVPAPSDVDLDELGAMCPVPADSSQLDAIANAVGGRTFVLEGPPGTGKSQTITNLLARCLAEGKRVLFVAEKRAALDVVKQRLGEIGLDPFCLDLHDKGARPAAVRAQLAAALDASDPERAPRPDHAALRANTEAVRASSGSLRRYAERLHEPNGAGLSFYSARAQQLASAPDIAALPVPPAVVAGLSVDDFTALRDVLHALPAVADLARPARLHPWGFVDPLPGVAVDAESLHGAGQAMDTAIDAALNADIPAAVLALVDRPEALDAWADVMRAPRFALTVIDACAPPQVRAELQRVDASISGLSAAVPGWVTMIDARILDRPDTVAHVTAVHAAAVAAEESFFIGRKKRRRAVLSQLQSSLLVDAAEVPLRELGSITGELLGSATAVANATAGLAALPLPALDLPLNPWAGDSAARVSTALRWAKALAGTIGVEHPPQHEPQPGAAAPASPLGSARGAIRELYATTPPDVAAASALTGLSSAWRALAGVAGMPEGEASTRLWARWAHGAESLDAAGSPANAETSFTAQFFTAWTETRSARNLGTVQPVTAQRWIDLLHHIEPLRRHRLDEARAGLLAGAFRADDAALAFERGVADASMIERGDATALAAFDVAAHNRSVSRFVTSADSIRGELPRAIPADILAQRRFAPWFAGGAMGLLSRQLKLKRGGMRVRTLMEEFGDLITQITPCMLMSPESVARFFPADAAWFDVVVFDEASQIRVADAVGAMGRGASVVVVGDSKQMPPSRFAEVSLAADEFDGSLDDVASGGAVADEESILTECVQARVPSIWLSWHYRSQDESLIAFSNQQYYQGRLSTFPAPLAASASGSRMDTAARPDAEFGVSLVRVDGQFDRAGNDRLRTNRVEAEAIVREVERRFEASTDGSPSLGVITFNAPQRTLIEELLRDAPDERIGRALEEADGLFVKNLENVQGDERDAILFSVAFSANERGVIPLNFGPLSQLGGERRLNVAVTRARRQVVLFASFDPEHLRAEQTTALGVQHLKAYLQLARDGADAAGSAIHRSRMIDRHRDDIADELRSRGWAVTSDVGLSDFRVDLSLADATDPSTPLVAVLLDGEPWHRRRTVADRDGLPVNVLRNLMRWPAVERVWLPEWLDDREGTIERLADALTTAARVRVSATSTAEAVRLDTLLDDGQLLVADDAELGRDDARPHAADLALPAHPYLEPYTPFIPTPRGKVSVLDALPRANAAALVGAVIDEIVDAEGPVSLDRLAKLTAACFGLTRVSADRAAAILATRPSGTLQRADEFAWPHGTDQTSWRTARATPPGFDRPLESVSLEELANGMGVVADLGAGMQGVELQKAVLVLFGGKRLTPANEARLDAAMTLGLASGRLQRADDGTFTGS